ncbi:MAG: hypothetical protein Q8Q09_24140 [Deltaproteobacteria bacterium]|nr:hypothetical protein [Deltaproteobacteria bacterium]
MSTILSQAERRVYGSLALCCAHAASTSLGLRPLGWYNSLCRLGVTVPFFVVHDLGAVLLGAKPPFTTRPEMLADAAFVATQAADRGRLMQSYCELLDAIADTEVATLSSRSNVEDAVITTILARALGPINERWKGPRTFEAVTANAELLTLTLSQLPAAWQSVDRRVETDYLKHITTNRLPLLLALEQIDLDTLDLLRMFGREAGALPETELVDLLNVFSSPDANDVVNFSLDILPSVLETRRGGGQQTFSVDGYSGVSTRGALDALVLSEMAYDDDLFDQRFMENEMLYYAHEAQMKPPPRTYQILVDASASMRGARAVFARGLAIALAKKMTLLGFDANVRFFDSRLYEPLRVRRHGRTNGPMHIAGVLTFKGEHGRNYARVFSQFASELERQRDRASVTAYVITHAECHMPVELVRRIRENAELYAVFMLPSRGALELDYLHLLTQHEVVTEQALRDKSARASRALSIVEAATEGARTSMLPPGRQSKVPPAPNNDSTWDELAK